MCVGSIMLTVHSRIVPDRWPQYKAYRLLPSSYRNMNAGSVLMTRYMPSCHRIYISFNINLHDPVEESVNIVPCWRYLLGITD
jgi:hypothetical protein